MPSITVVAHEDKLRPEVRRAFRDALFMAELEVDWSDVAKAKRARKAAARAVEAGADIVVACGGDGTVRATSEALVGTDVALAVLPVGTANLFATGYGLPTAPADLVALLTAGTRRTLDSGVCNDQTFNVMAGVGLDARMIEDADEHKERLGMLAYLRAGLRHAWASDVFDAQVTVDGEPFFAGPASCVLVGNIGTLKAGVMAFPDASPTDGLLDVGIVTAAGLREWATVLAKTVIRRPDESKHTTIGQGREIDVRLDRSYTFQLDGGTKGTSDRLYFTLRPGSLTLCAPAS